MYDLYELLRYASLYNGVPVSPVNKNIELVNVRVLRRRSAAARIVYRGLRGSKTIAKRATSVMHAAYHAHMHPIKSCANAATQTPNDKSTQVDDSDFMAEIPPLRNPTPQTLRFLPRGVVRHAPGAARGATHGVRVCAR